MLLIKTWITNRVAEMADVEANRTLPPATKELLQNFIRLSKGLISALENWLKKVS